MTDQPFPRRQNNDRRAISLLVLGLLALVATLYVAGHYATDGKLPQGTTVAGVPLGGLTTAAAEHVLADRIADRAESAVVVSAAGLRHRIEPGPAGLAVDVPASVAQTSSGRSWDPVRMWAYLAGGDDYPAVVTVDQDALAAAVADFADEVDRPGRDGSVTFAADRATAHQAVPGRRLDVDAAASVVAAAYPSEAGRVVPLPVSSVAPEITDEEVRAAMEEFANPAMSAPVILEVRDRNVVLRPSSYAPALSLRAEDGSLRPALDEERLLRVLRPALERASLAPRDATVKLVHGRPRVMRARNGVTVRPRDITDGFLDLVVATGRDRTRPVRGVVDRPRFSTADARRLGITEVVSSFTTHYPHADYRNTNLGRAAELIDGTVLKPGETFSLNDTVGERTKANGFTKGFIISDGVYKEDFGGGVSQVATTTFNAAFFAGLRDVEHKPHSFYIDRYPIGREATVAWPTVDLRFRNDTPYGILIEAGITRSSPSRDGAMTVRMWSTKHWDITAGVSDRYNPTAPAIRHLSGPGCVPNTGYGGFDIDVFRYFHKPGKDQVVRTETMHTTYTPSDTVVCS